MSEAKHGCFTDTTLSIAQRTQALIGTTFISQALACNGDTVGEITAVERNDANTTPTTIEEFAHTFSYVYNM